MNHGKFNDIINLMSAHIFKECKDLYVVNLSQVHSLINLLVKANVPFNLNFNEGTNENAKNFSLQVYITPTTSITKTFQLEEGNM